jgi:hypothetical protein
VGVALGDADGFAVGLGLGLALGDAEGFADGDGDGEGDALPLTATSSAYKTMSYLLDEGSPCTPNLICTV